MIAPLAHWIAGDEHARLSAFLRGSFHRAFSSSPSFRGRQYANAPAGGESGWIVIGGSYDPDHSLCMVSAHLALVFDEALAV